jgi:tRNA-dihydrouridine synthase 3
MSASEMFKGRLIMAPMSRGTDLPFRRLAHEWGAEVCVGEMAYAHKILRDENESVLLRRHPSEANFGVQLAGKKPHVMADAARRAEECGADFVDVNLGCPIEDTTKRGFGAALLLRQSRVGDLVAAMKRSVSIPVTIKMRLGWSNEKPTFLKVAKAAADAGVDAITLHPRSRNQRYRRAADWDRVAELVNAVNVPVIGNGDILTWRDAKRRMEETGCAAVMVGRWALTKPWIFREFAEERDIEPDVDERLAIINRYIDLCREHFGDDGKGRQRTRRFLVFHQDFFRRYRKGADTLAVNSSDPRDWGGAPEGKLEQWLARGDEDAVEALADWLVDGKDPVPPGEVTGAPRAVKVEAYG